ncbi:uncharacterized protein [Diadema setosum]|uniref:uncharacterized protein n=1 Tax=Diadema setosum TaxID=31175 RepID=UPI003B3B9222
MPNLETLELFDVKIADDFFLGLDTSAAGAKLKSITHRAGPDISPAASKAYAKSICTMPNLETLELFDVKIADDFFFGLDTSAAGAKLKSITHRAGPDISPAASKAYAKSICTMPNLETLELFDVNIADDFFLGLDTSAAGAKCLHGTCVSGVYRVRVHAPFPGRQFQRKREMRRFPTIRKACYLRQGASNPCLLIASQSASRKTPSSRISKFSHG